MNSKKIWLKELLSSSKEVKDLSKIEGIQADDLIDPWGGKYYLDEKREIQSSSNKDRILLFDKKKKEDQSKGEGE